jgi:hypothetical protein
MELSSLSILDFSGLPAGNRDALHRMWQLPRQSRAVLARWCGFATEITEPSTGGKLQLWKSFEH